MNEKVVSIIVPVYNVEKYIKKCVESLMCQDYKSIEIILVDDGSHDSSGTIIDNLAERDDRIVVIHKENGGVSSARNVGLEKATGEYVLFVDGDDWVDVEYVSYFMNLLISTKTAVGMNKNNYTVVNQKTSLKEYMVDSEKVIEWLYLGDVFVAVWNKIYNKAFLDKYNIRFDESIWYGEGMLFNIVCLQYVDKVSIGEKCVYHQTPNPQSAMRKFNLESQYCGIRSLEIQKEISQKWNKKIEKAWRFHKHTFNWYIMSGIACSNQKNRYKDVYEDCAKKLRKDFWVAINVNNSLKTKIYYLCLAINPYYMSDRVRRKVGCKDE